MTDVQNATRFETFPLDPLPDLPEFKSLIDVWDTVRGDFLLARWQNISVDDIMPWIGRLAVSKLEGEELHAVLFGGAFVELFGRELTGKSFFATLALDEHELLHGHFKNLIDGPCIGHVSGDFPIYDRGHLHLDVLELPLSENGEDVSGFLHVLADE